jgi:hypothetical protein
MPTRLESLLKKCPVAYHVTYSSNVGTILKHGLFSADALKKMAGSKSGFRPNQLPIDCAELGHVTLRDQEPMRSKVLDRCLQGISTRAWYDLIDRHVFFFLDLVRAKKLRGKYSDQRVLEIPVTNLLREYGSNAYLTPINSGAVAPAYARRSCKTFHPLGEWVHNGFTDEACRRANRPVELAFRQEKLQGDFSLQEP